MLKTAISASARSFAGLLLLAGCANSAFHSKNASVEKTFSDGNAKAGYKVLVEKPTFLEVSSDLTKETRSKSDSKLAATIKNVRLDMDEVDPSRVNVKISVTGSSALELTSSLTAKGNTGYVFSGVSKDGRFYVSGLCAENFCEHASFLVREEATSKFVFVDYTRSIEYLKPEDLSKVTASSKDDRELLSDVIEYHLPITRHAARIAGREAKSAIVDLLIVARPAVDAQDESFDDEDDAQASTPSPTQPAPAPQSARNEEHTIELEAVSADSDDVSGAAESESSKPSTPSGATLTLTSNPYEVYKITIPTERLKSLNIRYPSILPASFNIVPAENQRLGEPVHRLALIAEAFVESDVKIFMNACNIYVRSVMMLAGYTKGGTPLANQFGQLFQVRGQGLNEWERVSFKNNGSSTSAAVNQSGLQTLTREIPNGYATVAQWVREGGRHGHVGILARLDNTVYFMDGTLNNTKRGLKKVEVTTMKSLTNAKSRENLTVYGMKGVIKPRRSI